MARRTRFVRPAPRTKMWIGAGVGSTTIVASADQVIFTYSAAVLTLRPFTILRTRMTCSFESDQSTAAERPEGDFGIIVVTETAAALGTTAIPDPSSTDGNPEADWFVHQPMMTTIQVSGTPGVAWSPAASYYTIDSKAMRKVGPDDDAVGIFSETSGSGAVLISRGRQLIQLH